MATLVFSTFFVICVVSLLFPAASAVDFDFPAVFNFGDSNSDTGNLVAAGIGDPLQPPNGRSYFSRPAGRFCDGRLIIDFLMDAIDKPLLHAYLNSISSPSFQNGCNFAAAGSTILPATKYSVSPFSFRIQVAQFLQFKNELLLSLSRGEIVWGNVPQEEYFKKGLYMFDFGQNDLASAFYSKTEDQVTAHISTILLEFERGLKILYDQGARRFWIHNTGPLGCLAQNIAIFGKDPLKRDEFGCLSAHNRVAKLFNIQLHALCTELRGVFADSSIIYVDVFNIKFDLIVNYSRYVLRGCISSHQGSCPWALSLPRSSSPHAATGSEAVLGCFETFPRCFRLPSSKHVKTSFSEYKVPNFSATIATTPQITSEKLLGTVNYISWARGVKL